MNRVIADQIRAAREMVDTLGAAVGMPVSEMDRVMRRLMALPGARFTRVRTHQDRWIVELRFAGETTLLGSEADLDRHMEKIGRWL